MPQLPTTNVRPTLVWPIVVVAAVLAIGAPGEPTGSGVVDAVQRALLGGVVTWFAARSRNWTRFLLSGAALVLAGSIWWFVAAAVALVVAAAGTFAEARRPGRYEAVIGAVVGAVSIQVLLRAAEIGRFGFTALVTGVVTVAVLLSGYRAAAPVVQRRLRMAGGAVVGFVLLATAGAVATVWRSAGQLDEALHYAQIGSESVADGRQGPATLAMWAAEVKFTAAQRTQRSALSKPARVVPVLAQHIRLVTTATDAGRNVSADAYTTLSEADYRDLRGSDGTFDVALIRSMQAPVRGAIATTRQTLARIDSVSSPWLLDTYRDRVAEHRRALAGTIPHAEAALDALEMAPDLLGADDARTYLVLFGNPAESRGLGGFIGAWAELEADDGRVRLTRHGHIDEFNDASDWRTRSISGPDEYLARYSRLQPHRYIQNVSASPDFPTVAQVAGELYDQAMGTRVDGVLYVDAVALGALLEITGPVLPANSWNRVHPETAADFLMHDQYLTYEGRTTRRVDVLSATAEATFTALTEGDLPSIGRITDTLAPMVHQRRLLFWAEDAAVADYLDGIGLSGAFPESGDGDLLSVRISNASTNKADFYLDQSTRYAVHHDPATGATRATARITFDNRAPTSGEPAYVLGNQDTRTGKLDGRPFGSDTVSVSVYSALRPSSSTVDGVARSLQTQRELGAWVGSQTVTVPPGGRVVVEIELAGRLPPGADYRLTVVPQPSARPRTTTVVVQPPETGTGRSEPVATRSFGDELGHLSVPVVSRSGS